MEVLPSSSVVSPLAHSKLQQFSQQDVLHHVLHQTMLTVCDWLVWLIHRCYSDEISFDNDMRCGRHSWQENLGDDPEIVLLDPRYLDESGGLANPDILD